VLVLSSNIGQFDNSATDHRYVFEFEIIMLTVEKFKENITPKDGCSQLCIVVDIESKQGQLYIVGYGGMGTTISFPVEEFGSEVKAFVIEMIENEMLVIDDKAVMLLEKNIVVKYYTYCP
jgi:hypothetical protein